MAPAPRLDRARARAIAGGFTGTTILVVGDVMLDRFVWGSVSRISPEAPVPVVRLERESESLGGAGNVAMNVVALGGRAIPVGVRGEDRDGERLEALCREAGVTVEGLVAAPGRPTTVKMRVVAHHQHVVRVDREEDGPLDPKIAAAIRARASALLPRASAVVVSDYDKGAIAGEDLEAVGRRLLARLGSPYLLITRGDRGMLLLGGPAGPLAIPAAAREVFDVSGAGDTVVATLALALASGATMEEAAILANQAAGVVVGKLGTATLTREELLG